MLRLQTNRNESAREAHTNTTRNELLRGPESESTSRVQWLWERTRDAWNSVGKDKETRVK